MKKLFCIVSLMAVLSMGKSMTIAQEQDSIKPPVAKKVAKTTTIHGDTLVDDYYWLREKTNPEVMSYLEAENAYTDAVMKDTENFQAELYKEMLGRIKETDVNVPYKKGDYFYYSRTEAGKQYPILCRKRGSLDAKEEVYLDLNELAKGLKFLGMGPSAVSDDGNLLAFQPANVTVLLVIYCRHSDILHCRNLIRILRPARLRHRRSSSIACAATRTAGHRIAA